MNYPIWDQPASGLVIAFISVFHVFISHFAVGGGLFLVLAEHKARRNGDSALLDYTRRHSRFFMLVTLVLGAITGVGIWFAIGLVHPSGTSSLINTFVWGWGMEWAFFLIEIAAAMVYFYGWDRLTARTHLAVGWIYFIAAWISMVIINGIISFQLTPGAWVTTRSFLDGLLNPTYWPSLTARTFVAIGLAGIYALLTNARTRDLAFKKQMARWAGLRWVLPMAAAVPLSLVWYLQSAINAGIPAGRIFGAEGNSVGAIIAAVFTGNGSGYPILQNGAFVCLTASAGAAVLLLFISLVRPSRYGLASATGLLILGQLAFAGGEWVREDLRKPYVIGRYMFVNAVRLPAPSGVEIQAADRFALPALNKTGVLAASLWNPAPPGFDPLTGPSSEYHPKDKAEVWAEAGELVFRQLCTACHTIDGYLAVRPQVEGAAVAGLERLLDTLALPVDDNGDPTGWDDPHLRLKTRRGFRMPPFTGTAAEKHALAIYLARLGGDPEAGIELEPIDTGSDAAAIFEDQCAICHEPDSDMAIEGLIEGIGEEELFEMIGRLDELSDEMFPFEGSEDERRALAAFLAGGAPPAPGPDAAAIFEEQCAICHEPDSDMAIEGMIEGLGEDELFEMIGTLEELNDEMFPFEGSDDERRALAAHLVAAGGKEVE